MPTVLKAGKYRFFFFSNEGFEAPHIHVESGGKYAKFWLEPIDLVRSIGYKERELSEIREIIQKNVKFFKEKWDAYVGF